MNGIHFWWCTHVSTLIDTQCLQAASQQDGYIYLPLVCLKEPPNTVAKVVWSAQRCVWSWKLYFSTHCMRFLTVYNLKYLNFKYFVTPTGNKIRWRLQPVTVTVTVAHDVNRRQSPSNKTTYHISNVLRDPRGICHRLYVEVGRLFFEYCIYNIIL